MRMPIKDIFRTVHVAALCLCAIFLPWSTALLSIAQMVLVANWLVSGVVRKDLCGRFRAVRISRSALIFLSFLGLHIVGLLWTSAAGMSWGLDLVRILAPVLVFTVVLVGSDRLSAKELRTVLLFGAWSVIVSTIACMAMQDLDPGEYRQLSRFISHIRLTLLLCFAVVVFLYYRSRSWLLVAHVVAVVWALYMINKLGSIQGFLILGVIGAVVLWRAIAPVRATVRICLRATLLLLPLAIGMSVWNDLEHYSRLPDPNTSGYGSYTAGGEAYTFDATNPQMENGEHVWAWIAWDELRRTWSLRSSMQIDATDADGHILSDNLVRYLASKGLRKDSVSLMSLTDAEVKAIEGGAWNASKGKSSKLRERYDEVMFEVGEYRAYGKANGHSVTMRLEFWKAGIALAAAHWWNGVGTGDTQQAFNDQYASMGSTLLPEWRLRAHEQYLTWWISFGVFGFLWCLVSILWPAYQEGAWREPLFVGWVVIFGISCLTDDTVETQAGATFFALYYTLLVFGRVNGRSPLAPVSATHAPDVSHAPVPSGRRM